jgi:RpiR family carbohydrate utilization transcriptional regulator
MLERIRKFHDALSAAEQRVSEWVISNPNQSVSESLARVAQAAGVSEPTVVRFCRSLGCKGFRDFKVRLAQSLASTRHPIHRAVEAGDDGAELIAKVIGSAIEALEQAKLHLRPDRVAAAAEAMVRARRIDFIGIGASGIVAADAQNKFFRLGIPGMACSDTPTMRQLATLAASEQVVVAISKSGESTEVLEASQQFADLGASVVAITSPRSSLAAIAQIPLLIDIDEDTGVYTPMSSRLAQLAVLDVLQVALALRLGETGRHNLRITKVALGQGKASQAQASKTRPSSSKH